MYKKEIKKKYPGIKIRAVRQAFQKIWHLDRELNGTAGIHRKHIATIRSREKKPHSMLIVRRELRKEYDVWILCAPCEFSNMIVYILLSLGLISHVNCKGKLLPYELPQIKGFSLSLSLFRVYWISLHAVRHGKNKSKTVTGGLDLPGYLRAPSPRQVERKT